MNTSKARGLTFAVFVDKKNVTQDDLDFPNGNRTIRIVPIIIGSKKSGYFANYSGRCSGGVGAMQPLGSARHGAQCYGCRRFNDCWRCNSDAFASAAGLASKQSADNKASYAFGGVTNTAAQGYPVPLLYGKRRIGGAIISAGIYVEDQL
jgi:predicted phage tail protein